MQEVYILLDINKIKIVLFDYDNTVCLHPRHNSEPSQPFINRVFKEGSSAWSHCSTNAQLADFMSLLKDLNIRMGLISATKYYPIMVAKLLWVKEKYGYNLENFCSGASEDKVKILEAISDTYGYSKEEIMIIDDYWLVCETCADAGFVSWTPMQVVNFINDLVKRG